MRRRSKSLHLSDRIAFVQRDFAAHNHVTSVGVADEFQAAQRKLATFVNFQRDLDLAFFSSFIKLYIISSI